MGAPTYAVLAETYTQHMEHNQIYPVLIKYQIIGYFRYVDSILIICNKKNMGETLAEFNNKPIQNSPSNENNVSPLIFGILTIHRKKTKLEFALYRKHTQTDIIILNDFCCFYEHKISSINYLTNIVHTHPVTKEAKGRN
jgi:hypothetical protein